MARGRPWTEEEDGELRHIAKLNRTKGLRRRQVLFKLQLQNVPAYAARLRAFAKRHDRSYAAVRQRASRLGLRSTPTTVRTPPKVRPIVLSEREEQKAREFVLGMLPIPAPADRPLELGTFPRWPRTPAAWRGTRRY